MAVKRQQTQTGNLNSKNGSGTEIRTPNLAGNRSLQPVRNGDAWSPRAAGCRL